MSLPIAYVAPVLVDSDGRVCVDAVCLGCGYNLRSLPEDAVCPECAQPVRLSLRGEQLRFSQARWVRLLARGATCLVISVAAVIGTAMLFPVLGFLSFGNMTNGPPVAMVLFGLLMAAVTIGATIMWIVGAVLITTRDPAAVDKPEGWTARRVVRLCLCMLVVPVVAWIAGLVWGANYPSRWVQTSTGPFLDPVFWIITIVGAIGWFFAGLVGPLAMLRHFMSLMRRIPRPGLVTFAKIEFWGTLVSGILVVGSYAFFFVFALGFARSASATATIAATMPASSPALATMGYTGGGRPMVRSVVVGPTGPVTVASTMPVTMPTFPGPPAGFIAASIGTGVSGCIGLCVGIAGCVLLILVQRALSEAAGQAEKVWGVVPTG